MPDIVRALSMEEPITKPLYVPDGVRIECDSIEETIEAAQEQFNRGKNIRNLINTMHGTRCW